MVSIPLIFQRVSYNFYNIYALPVVFAGLIILLLGIFILAKNRKAIGAFAFLTLSLSFSIWLLGISLVYISRTPDVAEFWTRFFWSGVVYIGSAIYFFTQSVLGTIEKKKNAVIFGFILSTLFLFSLHLTNWLIAGVNHYFWGFYAKAGPAVWIFLAIFVYQMVASFMAYYGRYKIETSPVMKKQIRMVAIAFVVAYTSSVDYLPAIGIEIYPFGYLPMVGFASVLFYTMVRYHLLDIQTVLHKTLMWSVATALTSAPIILIFFKYHTYTNFD